MSKEEASGFVAECLALNEALEATGGKWGVA